MTSDKCYENKGWTRGYKENDVLGGVDPYSASKASSELIIRAYRESFFNGKENRGVSSARAGNVIGGGDWSSKRLIPDCIRALRKGLPINLRNPNFNRPWQHVLEPLYGYLVLGQKIYNNPKKFSGPWNFGTRKNTVTNVLEIVREIVKIWGKGKITFKKNNRYYEQINLQLNINKSIKYLNWSPKYSIKKSIKVTTEWYKNVLVNKMNIEKITENQIREYMDVS